MSEQFSKNTDVILWKEAGFTTELNYIEQISWILAIEYLDDLEQERLSELVFVGKNYDYIFNSNHWSSWVSSNQADSVLIQDNDNALMTNSFICIEESVA